MPLERPLQGSHLHHWPGHSLIHLISSYRCLLRARQTAHEPPPDPAAENSDLSSSLWLRRVDQAQGGCPHVGLRQVQSGVGCPGPRGFTHVAAVRSPQEQGHQETSHSSRQPREAWAQKRPSITPAEFCQRQRPPGAKGRRQRPQQYQRCCDRLFVKDSYLILSSGIS